MVHIKKTSHITPATRARIKGLSEPASASEAPSPFSIKPPDPLKSIVERKSRTLSEGERLALLQRALGPFAEEARKRLPKTIRSVEKKVRRKMLEEGFSEPVASEAGDEVVTALLDTQSKKSS